MNVNSINLMSVDKNLKLNKMANEPSNGPVVEPTVSNPESAMKMLEAQANNNLAFQGLNVKLPNLARKAGVTSMAALMALLPLLLQSCHFSYEETNNFDLSALNTFTAMLAQYMEQQEKYNEEQMALMRLMYAEMQNQTGYAENIFTQIKINNEFQSAIVSALIANGMSQEEANAKLQELIDKVDNGQITNEAFVKEIMDILGNILFELKGLRDDINKNHDEYMAAKGIEIRLLSEMYKDGKLQTSVLFEICKNGKETNAKLDNLAADLDVLIEIASDDTKYNNLIETINNCSQEEYAKYAAMFEKLGLTMLDIYGMSREDFKAFVEEYKGNEAKQNEILNDIRNSANLIANHPGVTSDDLKAAVAVLVEALKNGDTALLEELGGIKDEIVKVKEMLEKMYKQMQEDAKNFAEFSKKNDKNWNEVFINFDNTIDVLKNIDKKGDYLNANIQNLKDAQDKTNLNLEKLYEAAGDIEAAIKAINNAGSTEVQGMTYEQFLAAYKQVNAEGFDKFKKYMEETGLAKTPETIKTVADLLKALNIKVDNLEKYSADLAAITAKLDELVAQGEITQEKATQIAEILANWKHECEHNITVECSCGNENEGYQKPGILDDLNNLI